MPTTKLIHQIWWQGWDELPERYNENVQSVIDHNPDWQHIKWDEKSIRELIASLGQEYLDKFNKFSILHQRIDFARYAILYTKGGVSVDIDAEAHKGFDSTPHINDSDFIVSYNSTDRFINNATIMVAPHHPILKEVLDEIRSECKMLEDDTLCVINSTGIGIFNKVLDRHPNEVTRLENTYFEPCSGSNDQCSINLPENTILNHKHDKSWVNPWYKKIERFYYEMKPYRDLILGGFLVLVALLIWTRLSKKNN